MFVCWLPLFLKWLLNYLFLGWYVLVLCLLGVLVVLFLFFFCSKDIFCKGIKKLYSVKKIFF